MSIQYHRQPDGSYKRMSVGGGSSKTLEQIRSAVVSVGERAEGANAELSEVWAAISALQNMTLEYPVLMASGNLSFISQVWPAMPNDKLTSIRFVDSYAPTGAEDASAPMGADGTGSVTGYHIGSTLIISGNGSGRIRLHANCRNLFGGIVNLQSIEGLELLDASNVTSLNGAFANCRSIQEVDLSSWKVPKLTQMNGMFNLCQHLEWVKMPRYGIPAGVSTISAFAECHKLKEVDFGRGATVLSKQTFHRCLNLESVTGLSGAEEIGDFAFVYTPKVRTDLVPSKIHTLGASALRLSGMEDQKSFSAVPNVGQSATRQARWDADQLKAIRAVQLPDVHIDVPNPDSISRYPDIAYIGAEYTEDGQVGMIYRYGCAAMTLYHIYQAYHAPLDDDMLYPNFEDFWYDAIDVERNWSTKGYDWNNHIYKMVEALGWRKSGQIEVVDASAKAKIGELLSAGKVVFVNMVSSRPDGTTHAVAVIGSDSATDKLEVLDSCNYDSASVHPWVSWMSFEDMFTQESVDVNPEGKPGKELVYLIEFTREE